MAVKSFCMQHPEISQFNEGYKKCAKSWCDFIGGLREKHCTCRLHLNMWRQLFWVWCCLLQLLLQFSYILCAQTTHLPRALAVMLRFSIEYPSQLLFLPLDWMQYSMWKGMYMYCYSNTCSIYSGAIALIIYALYIRETKDECHFDLSKLYNEAQWNSTQPAWTQPLKKICL